MLLFGCFPVPVLLPAPARALELPSRGQLPAPGLLAAAAPNAVYLFFKPLV
jgi:hypothetical protein